MRLEDALRSIVGAREVLADPALTAGYERDWTGRFAGRARLVVRPADTGQTAAVLAACAEAGAPLVPQGGNTGLVGGSVPRGGEVVLSLARLATIEAPDGATGQVTVGAGVTLARLLAAARGWGLDAALDFAARDSATVGGVVACDAGGARALRYGTARARVAGVEAVLADGSVVSRLGGLTKDNAGYDLSGLLVGSEGTLGVVTRVRWRLEPSLPCRVAALVGLESVGEAAELLGALRREAPSLESADFFLDDGLELVLAHQRRAAPLRERHAVYVLVECAGRVDPLDELAGALEAAGVGDDVVVADDTATRESLWALREGHAEAINAAGVPVKLDVGVPLAALGAFIDDVRSLAGSAGAPAVLFGHLGDGNVHVNLLGGADAGSGLAGLSDAVLERVLACGGTISAEHGIGVAKAGWLERARGSAEVAAMRAIKAALDPDSLLNPGVVLPLGAVRSLSGPG